MDVCPVRKTLDQDPVEVGSGEVIRQSDWSRISSMRGLRSRSMHFLSALCSSTRTISRERVIRQALRAPACVAAASIENGDSMTKWSPPSGRIRRAKSWYPPSAPHRATSKIRCALSAEALRILSLLYRQGQKSCTIPEPFFHSHRLMDMQQNDSLWNVYRATYREYARKFDALQRLADSADTEKERVEAAVLEMEQARIVHNDARDQLARSLARASSVKLAPVERNEDRVRKTAQLLWELAGRPDGSAERDWNRAEQLVRTAVGSSL
jgi:hypothetical protein